VTAKNAQRLAGVCVPEADGHVAGGGGDSGAIGAISDGIDDGGVSCKAHKAGVAAGGEVLPFPASKIGGTSGEITGCNGGIN